MSDGLLDLLILAAALGCGLNAGVFFAFSAFVMPALARLPPSQGIAAMQSINITAVTPLFMSAMFGTAAVCLLLALATVFTWPRPGAPHVLAGTVLYLAGTILVTIVFNVPQNNALDAMDPAGADSTRRWNDFLRVWTRWNHVRTAAALIAAGLLTMAYSLLGR